MVATLDIKEATEGIAFPIPLFDVAIIRQPSDVGIGGQSSARCAILPFAHVISDKLDDDADDDADGVV